MSSGFARFYGHIWRTTRGEANTRPARHHLPTDGEDARALESEVSHHQIDRCGFPTWELRRLLGQALEFLD
ncbi:unnamed protein product [Mesocestoides corti]|uniref:Uncharacterized protein n=1 Tax=Mesocestoides corti TaxID=53468 RepID=A0A0R3UHU8_MESCO|nr:unnamed protein product [Mesocestoides corti]